MTPRGSSPGVFDNVVPLQDPLAGLIPQLVINAGIARKATVRTSMLVCDASTRIALHFSQVRKLIHSHRSLQCDRRILRPLTI